jgi:hypothetical protein
MLCEISFKKKKLFRGKHLSDPPQVLINTNRIKSKKIYINFNFMKENGEPNESKK